MGEYALSIIDGCVEFNNVLHIFENPVDFLSYLKHFKINAPQGNVIITNGLGPSHFESINDYIISKKITVLVYWLPSINRLYKNQKVSIYENWGFVGTMNHLYEGHETMFEYMIWYEGRPKNYVKPRFKIGNLIVEKAN